MNYDTRVETRIGEVAIALNRIAKAMERQNTLHGDDEFNQRVVALQERQLALQEKQLALQELEMAERQHARRMQVEMEVQ